MEIIPQGEIILKFVSYSKYWEALDTIETLVPRRFLTRCGATKEFEGHTEIEIGTTFSYIKEVVEILENSKLLDNA